MRKLTLTEWAALGEVVATVAVVISLLFVAYTIGQNTAALQGASDNILFERHAELANQFTADPSLAAIMVKMRSDDPQLSDVEAIRWEKYQFNLLDIWALAYMRHQADLLSERQWQAWDVYFIDLFRRGGERITRQRWNRLRRGFDAGFWAHVDSALFTDAASSE